MERRGRGEPGFYADALTERKCDAVPGGTEFGKKRAGCRRYGHYPVRRYPGGQFLLCRQHLAMLERGRGVKMTSGEWLTEVPS